MRPPATSTRVELDTDCVSPDSLKAAFEVAVDALLSRSADKGWALNWSTLQMAQTHHAGTTTLVLRTEIL